MRKAFESDALRRLLRDQGGQATLEYVLGLAMAISVVSVIGIGFRRSILALWEMISREVTAACPGCPADPTIRIR
jgi:Flp pilus assembly pilin Flp